MQIKECIDIVDSNYPNQYTTEEKVQWLSFLDGTIINDVLKTHEGYDGRYDEFTGYSADKLTVVLVVPSPYDRLYPAYLKMQIDNANGEKARYNASASVYNSYLDEYKKWYNRNHKSLLNGSGKNGRGVSVKVDVNLSDAEYEAIKLDVYNLLREDVDEVISHDKMYQIVTEYQQNNVEMFKGKDGETPVKGRDYFTETEINNIIEEAKGKDGEDGVSVTTRVEDIEGGHRVYFDEKNKTTTFDVMDGAPSNTLSGETVTIESDTSVYINTNSSCNISSPTVDFSCGAFTIHETTYGLYMGGNRLQEVAAPENNTDAANKIYVDNKVSRASTVLESRISSIEDVVDSFPERVSELDNDLRFITQEDVPTKLSEFENDIRFATVDAIPTKISAFENNSGYVTETDIPKKLSEFENDVGFLTEVTLPALAVSSFLFADYSTFYSGIVGGYHDTTNWADGIVIRIENSSVPTLYAKRASGAGNIPSTEEECVQLLESGQKLYGGGFVFSKYSEILGGDIGDIETALDAIIALQETLIGGDA